MSSLLGSVFALLSYAFHQLIRGLLFPLVALRPRAAGWQPFSENLQKKGFIPVISVVAPRWNCHGALAMIGPIRVQQELRLRTSALDERAESWSVVLYDGDSNTLEWTGSSCAAHSDVCWTVRSGAYSLTLRYYAAHEDLIVPELIVDGQALNVGRVFPGEAARYAGELERIRGKHGLYYRMLHYYVFHALRRGERRNGRWLQRHFLPVGNPDTQFRYGHLEPGQQLRLRCSSQQLERSNVYVAFYNWSSFPVHWSQLRELAWLSPRFDEAVGYAIRCVKTDSSVDDGIELTCELIGA